MGHPGVWGVLHGEEQAQSRAVLEEEVAGLRVVWEGNRKPKGSLELLVCMAENVPWTRGY